MLLEDTKESQIKHHILNLGPKGKPYWELLARLIACRSAKLGPYTPGLERVQSAVLGSDRSPPGQRQPHVQPCYCVI
jgi:hypothetical protein